MSSPRLRHIRDIEANIRRAIAFEEGEETEFATEALAEAEAQIGSLLDEADRKEAGA